MPTGIHKLVSSYITLGYTNNMYGLNLVLNVGLVAGSFWFFSEEKRVVRRE